MAGLGWSDDLRICIIGFLIHLGLAVDEVLRDESIEDRLIDGIKKNQVELEKDNGTQSERLGERGGDGGSQDRNVLVLAYWRTILMKVRKHEVGDNDMRSIKSSICHLISCFLSDFFLKRLGLTGHSY